jgi:hypothetical protein
MPSPLRGLTIFLDGVSLLVHQPNGVRALAISKPFAVSPCC